MEIEFMIFQALAQLLCGFIGIKLGYRSAVKKFEKGQLKKCSAEKNRL